MMSNPGSTLQSQFDQGELHVITERVDDIVLLIGQMIKMNLPGIIDQHIPRHGPQAHLSWGWTAIIWLAYILTEGDHRKVCVVDYIKAMHDSLRLITGQPIEVLDFDDDRLTHLLRHLSQQEVWQAIEQELSEQCIQVYELPTEVVRCDTTTVSGYHTVEEGGVMQFGHSKGDPTLPQFKLSTATLDLGGVGMPVATAVVSGEMADDGLYVGMVTRTVETLKKTGLLFVGDCKMSSLRNRQEMAAKGQYYLAPLALTGETAQSLPSWIDSGIEKQAAGALVQVARENERGEIELKAQGYEFDRILPGATAGGGEVVERVIIVHSPVYARRQENALEKNLDRAHQAMAALTPPPGRGKRQITQESELQAAIAQLEKQYPVEGFLEVTYECQTRIETRYVGRGRGSAERERREMTHVRYQITSVVRKESAIAAAKQRMGWKAYVTNAPKTRLVLEEAVLCYRNQYRIEHIYKRIKSHLNIEPLFVQRDDQIQGLTFLLTLGVRVLTLLEFVVRRGLQATKTKLSGFIPGNSNKKTDQLTAPKILKAFSGLTVTTIKDRVGKVLLCSLQTLSTAQKTILQILDLEELHAKLQNSQ
jgi:transposase